MVDATAVTSDVVHAAANACCHQATDNAACHKDSYTATPGAHLPHPMSVMVVTICAVNGQPPLDVGVGAADVLLPIGYQ